MTKDEVRDPARDALAEIVEGEEAHLPYHLRSEIMMRAATWVDTAVAVATATDPSAAISRSVQRRLAVQKPATGPERDLADLERLARRYHYAGIKRFGVLYQDGKLLYECWPPGGGSAEQLSHAEALALLAGKEKT